MLALALGPAVAPATAAPIEPGTKTVRLHAKDGSSVVIGRLAFTPRTDGRMGFVLSLDSAPFADHFLSMREFKCLQGASELQCHVPYPHANPAHVSADDLAWLEHALLFLYKKPGEFGANWRNGVYYRLQVADQRLVGTPQAVDLNLIAVPPPRPDAPPLRPALRDDLPAGARWFERLTID